MKCKSGLVLKQEFGSEFNFGKYYYNSCAYDTKRQQYCSFNGRGFSLWTFIREKQHRVANGFEEYGCCRKSYLYYTGEDSDMYAVVLVWKTKAMIQLLEAEKLNCVWSNMVLDTKIGGCAYYEHALHLVSSVLVEEEWTACNIVETIDISTNNDAVLLDTSSRNRIEEVQDIHSILIKEKEPYKCCMLASDSDDNGVVVEYSSKEGCTLKIMRQFGASVTTGSRISSIAMARLVFVSGHMDGCIHVWDINNGYFLEDMEYIPIHLQSFRVFNKMDPAIGIQDIRITWMMNQFYFYAWNEVADLVQIRFDDTNCKLFREGRIKGKTRDTDDGFIRTEKKNTAKKRALVHAGPVRVNGQVKHIVALFFDDIVHICQVYPTGNVTYSPMTGCTISMFKIMDVYIDRMLILLLNSKNALKLVNISTSPVGVLWAKTEAKQITALHQDSPLLDFDQKAQHFCIGLSSGEIEIRNLLEGTTIFKCVPPNSASPISYLHVGHASIVAGMNDGRICRWFANNFKAGGKPEACIAAHGTSIVSIRAIYDDHLISVSSDGMIKHWDAKINLISFASSALDFGLQGKITAMASTHIQQDKSTKNVAISVCGYSNGTISVFPFQKESTTHSTSNIQATSHRKCHRHGVTAVQCFETPSSNEHSVRIISTALDGTIIVSEAQMLINMLKLTQLQTYSVDVPVFGIHAFYSLVHKDKYINHTVLWYARHEDAVVQYDLQIPVYLTSKTRKIFHPVADTEIHNEEEKSSAPTICSFRNELEKVSNATSKDQMRLVDLLVAHHQSHKDKTQTKQPCLLGAGDLKRLYRSWIPGHKKESNLAVLTYLATIGHRSTSKINYVDAFGILQDIYATAPSTWTKPNSIGKSKPAGPTKAETMVRMIKYNSIGEKELVLVDTSASPKPSAFKHTGVGTQPSKEKSAQDLTHKFVVPSSIKPAWEKGYCWCDQTRIKFSEIKTPKVTDDAPRFKWMTVEQNCRPESKCPNCNLVTHEVYAVKPYNLLLTIQNTYNVVTEIFEMMHDSTSESILPCPYTKTSNKLVNWMFQYMHLKFGTMFSVLHEKVLVFLASIQKFQDDHAYVKLFWNAIQLVPLLQIQSKNSISIKDVNAAQSIVDHGLVFTTRVHDWCQKRSLIVPSIYSRAENMISSENMVLCCRECLIFPNSYSFTPKMLETLQECVFHNGSHANAYSFVLAIFETWKFSVNNAIEAFAAIFKNNCNVYGISGSALYRLLNAFITEDFSRGGAVIDTVFTKVMKVYFEILWPAEDRDEINFNLETHVIQPMMNRYGISGFKTRMLSYLDFWYLLYHYSMDAKTDSILPIKQLSEYSYEYHIVIPEEQFLNLHKYLDFNCYLREENLNLMPVKCSLASYGDQSFVIADKDAWAEDVREKFEFQDGLVRVAPLKLLSKNEDISYKNSVKSAGLTRNASLPGTKWCNYPGAKAKKTRVLKPLTSFYEHKITKPLARASNQNDDTAEVKQMVSSHRKMKSSASETLLELQRSKLLNPPPSMILNNQYVRFHNTAVNKDERIVSSRVRPRMNKSSDVEVIIPIPSQFSEIQPPLHTNFDTKEDEKVKGEVHSPVQEIILNQAIRISTPFFDESMKTSNECGPGIGNSQLKTLEDCLENSNMEMKQTDCTDHMIDVAVRITVNELVGNLEGEADVNKLIDHLHNVDLAFEKDSECSDEELDSNVESTLEESVASEAEVLEDEYTRIMKTLEIESEGSGSDVEISTVEAVPPVVVIENSKDEDVDDTEIKDEPQEEAHTESLVVPELNIDENSLVWVFVSLSSAIICDVVEECILSEQKAQQKRIAQMKKPSKRKLSTRSSVSTVSEAPVIGEENDDENKLCGEDLASANANDLASMIAKAKAKKLATVDSVDTPEDFIEEEGGRKMLFCSEKGLTSAKMLNVAEASNQKQVFRLTRMKSRAYSTATLGSESEVDTHDVARYYAEKQKKMAEHEAQQAKILSSIVNASASFANKTLEPSPLPEFVFVDDKNQDESWKSYFQTLQEELKHTVEDEAGVIRKDIPGNLFPSWKSSRILNRRKTDRRRTIERKLTFDDSCHRFNFQHDVSQSLTVELSYDANDFLFNRHQVKLFMSTKVQLPSNIDYEWRSERFGAEVIERIVLFPDDFSIADTENESVTFYLSVQSVCSWDEHLLNTPKELCSVPYELVVTVPKKINYTSPELRTVSKYIEVFDEKLKVIQGNMEIASDTSLTLNEITSSRSANDDASAKAEDFMDNSEIRLQTMHVAHDALEQANRNRQLELKVTSRISALQKNLAPLRTVKKVKYQKPKHISPVAYRMSK